MCGEVNKRETTTNLSEYRELFMLIRKQNIYVTLFVLLLVIAVVLGSAAWTFAQSSGEIAACVYRGRVRRLGYAEKIRCRSWEERITWGIGGGGDADADATNELNTAFTFDGTSLNVTDAGGTLSANLSDLHPVGGYVSSVASAGNLELCDRYTSPVGVGGSCGRSSYVIAAVAAGHPAEYTIEYDEGVYSRTYYVTLSKRVDEDGWFEVDVTIIPPQEQDPELQFSLSPARPIYNSAFDPTVGNADDWRNIRALLLTDTLVQLFSDAGSSGTNVTITHIGHGWCDDCSGIIHPIVFTKIGPKEGELDVTIENTSHFNQSYIVAPACSENIVSKLRAQSTYLEKNTTKILTFEVLGENDFSNTDICTFDLISTRGGIYDSQTLNFPD